MPSAKSRKAVLTLEAKMRTIRTAIENPLEARTRRLWTLGKVIPTTTS